MQPTDPFTEPLQKSLDGVYDSMDRIVLSGYYVFAQSPGGFRLWWRSMFGSDENLDNTHLMRLAARFSRRVWTAAKKNKIPVIKIRKGDRAHRLVQPYRPADRRKRGVFCITIHRAPNSVWEVQQYGNGGKNIRRKDPKPYVNHYAFHIQDPEWGHITVKVCGHAPFNAQVILNGHEYVAQQASKQKIPYTKEENCFTETPDLAGLSKVAETIRSKGARGRLKRVCERWVYSACLCYVLNVADQQRTNFHYDWSLYQAESSRNLMFKCGRHMEEVFLRVIERALWLLDGGTVKRLFGRKRPRRHNGKQPPRFEVVIERPAYDLIVFKVHFGLLTLKIYTKGERVLRVEAIVHNARKEFARGYGVDKFPEIALALRRMLDRFLAVLQSVNACWVTDETLEQLPEPSQLGASRVAGVDVNRARMRAVMQGVIALSPHCGGFRSAQLAERVREIIRAPYSARQASYDLRKLRAKGMVRKVGKTHRYESSHDGLRSMVALVVLREKVISPILAGARQARRRQPCRLRQNLEHYYENIQYDLEKLFQVLGIAA